MCIVALRGKIQAYYIISFLINQVELPKIKSFRRGGEIEEMGKKNDNFWGIILFECYRLCYHLAVIVTRFDTLAINGRADKDRTLDGPPAETKKPPDWVAFLLVEHL